MKFSIDKKLIFALLLWLMIWAGYNTDIFRLKFLDFPINFLDLFHGLRSLLPFLAGFLAIIFLLRKRPSLSIFRSPLGLLLVYALVGIVSSIFLSKEPLIALYWAFSYIPVLIVLFWVLVNSSSISHLFSLINLNWSIVVFITFALFAFFILQPNVIPLIMSGDFLPARPYEGLAGVPAEIETLGMPGTRPTGLGRYAAVAAIFALVRTVFDKKREKFLWYLLFLISFSILIFSQARTAILAFVFCSFLIFLLKSKSKIEIFGWSFFNLAQLVLVGLFLFYIPLFYAPYLLEKATIPEQEIVISIPQPIPQPPLPPILTTLSGRTTGVWSQSAELFLKSPLIGFGFHADRIFLQGQHAHNAILHALIQTGIIGTIPFILAFIWSWVILFKLLKKPSLTEKPFLIEVAGVMAFFMIRGITESSGAFFGTDWILLAPLLAYLQQLNTSLNQQTNEKYE